MIRFRLVELLSLLLLCFPGRALASDTYKDQLLERAKQLKLSSNLEWWDLVHYHDFSFLPGVRSLVDDKRFFLAEGGKEDPAAELFATIEGLFSPSKLKNKHPQCRFPARAAWLSEKLAIDLNKLPQVNCEKFNTWYQALDPKSLTLIFPSAYPNNPSSAFGHTLIRIDQKNSTPLLSYTANFAADANDPNALVYAVKGIFGGYSGSFSNAPYFEKVQQYGDLESRDIWEYQLNLTDKQVAQGVRHIWELREIKFDYFYFDENCSYHLLRIIDVARPGTNLARKLWLWVIPVDTVRAAVETPDLISDIEFRPSTVRVLKNRLNSVSIREVELAKSLALGKIESNDESVRALDQASQATVIDLSYDYLQYLLIAREKDTEEVRASMYHFLRARSAIDVETTVAEIKTPTIRPEQGHKTSRLQLAYGSLGGDSFGEVDFRPAYHDLLDPSGGYTEGAEIQFFNIAFREQEQKGFKLESINPLSIISLTPWDRLTKPMSWFVDLKAAQKNFGEDQRHIVYQAGTGFGLAYALASEITAYGLFQGRGESNDRFKDAYAIGAGGRAGVLLFPARKLSAKTEIEGLNFFAGETRNEYRFIGEGRFSLSKDVALRLSAERFQEVNTKDFEAKLSLDLYF